MAYQYNIPTWKTAPFVRIVIPLAAGIILQWNFQFPLLLLIVAFACFSLDIILFRFFPTSMHYKVQVLQGIIINLLLISFGAIITWQKDIRHADNWFGNYYRMGDYLVVKINEPPIEKEKSYKADGYVEMMIHKDSAINCKGKILLYFSKDSTTSAIHYGDRILIRKNIQSIKNSGNPGSFNYERYAAFQQTYNTVFLKKEDWILLNEKDINQFKKFIQSTRESILSVIRSNVKNDNNESGIDEALLIGYTNDLDKDLAQAYSNTGVPHIIAISGMSLGLIYMSLLWLFNKIRFIKRSGIIKMILLLICLWLFALLTGESASVLRSAIVLTCIIIGNGFNKKSSIFNSLAASAFILLCYNPYLLWDVGFQISYLAVISIILFRKPIFNWIDVKNKWLKKLWNLIAITLSVQILTFPICIYYFHQFPLLFLLTNIVAIPLSTIILFAELFLLALNWIPHLGIYLGKLISSLTWLLNKFILWVNSLPFALAGNLILSILSTSFLYGIVTCFSIWLIKKNKISFQLALCFALFFTALFTFNDWQTKQQNKMIVYNIPKHQAIDFVSGNNYQFIGDSILSADSILQNFQLKPGRIALQLNNKMDSLPSVFNKENFYLFKNKRVLLIDSKTAFTPSQQKTDLDIIVISKSPKLYISQLASVFNCKQYVFDGSNSLWKIDKWKKDCEKLHLRFYSIPDQGAFILNVE